MAVLVNDAQRVALLVGVWVCGRGIAAEIVPGIEILFFLFFFLFFFIKRATSGGKDVAIL